MKHWRIKCAAVHKPEDVALIPVELWVTKCCCVLFLNEFYCFLYFVVIVRCSFPPVVISLHLLQGKYAGQDFAL